MKYSEYDPYFKANAAGFRESKRISFLEVAFETAGESAFDEFVGDLESIGSPTDNRIYTSCKKERRCIKILWIPQSGSIAMQAGR